MGYDNQSAYPEPEKLTKQKKVEEPGKAPKQVS
jgi:hypothetical protein